MLGVSSVDAQAGPRVRTDTTLFMRRDAGPKRLLGAVGGTVIGTIAGAYAGYNILPHTPNGDDPGLIELVEGALVGGVVGAAFGASAPGLQSSCSFKTRFARSLLGAGAIAATVFFVGGGPNGDGSIVLLVPAGSVGGSLAALGRCWKSR